MELAKQIWIRRWKGFNFIKGLNYNIHDKEDLLKRQASSSNSFELLKLDESIKDIEIDLPELQDLILLQPTINDESLSVALVTPRLKFVILQIPQE